jgi:protease PrsW
MDLNILVIFKTYILPFVFGMIPLIIWLVFFLLRDWKNPEPKKVIIHAFLMGVLATAFVLILQYLIEAFTKINIPSFYEIIRYHDNFKAFVFVALVEELIKFLVIYITLRHSKHLDEAIDPMIYMIVCAIGFSAVENYFSIFNQLNTIVVPLQTLTARFLGANLLHIICSGVVGFFWSLQIYTKKHGLLVLGLVLAIAFHAVFNTLIFTYGLFAVLLMFISVFCGASILLWMFDVIEKLNFKINKN